MVVRKLLVIFLVALLFSCSSKDTIVLDKPILPIFSLNTSDNQEKQLNAFKESLDLMIIYTNNLEKVIKANNIEIDYNLIDYTDGTKYEKSKTR